MGYIFSYHYSLWHPFPLTIFTQSCRRVKWGWIRNLWNIGYPALTTPTPFLKIQKKSFFMTEHRFKFTPTKKRLTTSHLQVSEPVLKPPKLHNLLQFTPFHPWHFIGLPPSFARFCDTRISSSVLWHGENYGKW